MRWIVARFKWLMLVSGLLTCTMFYAAIAPQPALRSMFGATLEGPLAEIVVRNWSALITLVGVMLIYGAFHELSRPLIVAVAGISKLIFICLVLWQGQLYLGHQASIAIVIDSLMVILFIVYLMSVRRG